jgi:hypothetical protein
MNLISLDLKIRQMYAALGALSDDDISGITIQSRVTADGSRYLSINPNQGTSPEGLMNVVSQLLANIACLKDHLKVWCEKNGKVFNGENLINSNIDVATVHELWNLDKHGRYDRPSRSKLDPKLVDLRRAFRLTGGPSGSSAMMIFSFGGQPTVKRKTEGDGDASTVITGTVVDKNGTAVGRLEDICERATTAWETELKSPGVTIPTKTSS